MKAFLLLPLLSLCAASDVCSDFFEGSCDLSEDNIAGYDRFTATPEDCQVTSFSHSLSSLLPDTLHAGVGVLLVQPLGQPVLPS